MPACYRSRQAFKFPMDTDYIAIPALIMSVTMLIVVSLITPKPQESDWREFTSEKQVQ